MKKSREAVESALKIYSMIKTGITPDVNALSSLMLLATIILLTSFAFIQSRKIVGDIK